MLFLYNMTDIYSLFRKKKVYKIKFFDEVNEHLSKYPNLVFYAGVAYETHISLHCRVGILRIPYPWVTEREISIEFFKVLPASTYKLFNELDEALCEINKHLQKVNVRKEEKENENSLSRIMFMGGGIGITVS